jgi:hypothetical protein
VWCRSGPRPVRCRQCPGRNDRPDDRPQVHRHDPEPVLHRPQRV